MASTKAGSFGPAPAAPNRQDRGMVPSRRCLCLGYLALLAAVQTSRAAEPIISFNRDIRPILSDSCFQCHGPDSARRKANLRLDTEEGAFAPRKGSPALVPGSLDKSELYQRITAADENERMPPATSGHRLTPEQIALIRRWIEQGAKWEKHWAFLS